MKQSYKITALLLITLSLFSENTIAQKYQKELAKKVIIRKSYEMGGGLASSFYTPIDETYPIIIGAGAKADHITYIEHSNFSIKNSLEFLAYEKILDELHSDEPGQIKTVKGIDYVSTINSMIEYNLFKQGYVNRYRGPKWTPYIATGLGLAYRYTTKISKEDNMTGLLLSLTGSLGFRTRISNKMTLHIKGDISSTPLINTGSNNKWLNYGYTAGVSFGITTNFGNTGNKKLPWSDGMYKVHGG
ncbi:MAG: hypothetical protein KAG96_01335 [Ichthyobacteriaceae bacterium]|nr:hypothetical protein [Ichthyobacteriaceae bacterium]